MLARSSRIRAFTVILAFGCLLLSPAFAVEQAAQHVNQQNGGGDEPVRDYTLRFSEFVFDPLSAAPTDHRQCRLEQRN